MIQNLKVDVLYYRTASDFEMEFNLGGCCRMRTFTDKTDSRKGLVSLLARAVSRSRVIIVCGPLFDEKGLISTVAAAVGKPLVSADNTAFGIETDEKIEIIDGSMPLVTPEGFFGGCIIESGPQTIVLLTENKSIRKTIMKKLIHPYITEISYSAVHGNDNAVVMPSVPTTEAESEEVTEETPLEEAPDISVEETDEEAVEETAEEIVEEAVEDELFEINMDAALEQELREEIEAEVNGITLEDIEDEPEEDINPPVKEENPVYTPVSSYEEETEFTPVNPVNVWIIVLLVMLLLVIGVIAYLLVFIPLRDGIDIATYIRSLFNL